MTGVGDAATIDFRGARLSVAATGDGPTLGYLHGPLGNEGPPPIADHLPGWRVVAPSLPGFGNPFDCAKLHTLHDWIAATSEVIDAAGLSGRPLVASSVGAMLALELAAIRPEAFAELVLIAPFGLWRDDMPVADVYASLAGKERAAFAANSDALARFYEDRPGLENADVVERSVQRHITRSTAASILWQIPEFGFASRAYRVTCPVTLVWGEADTVIPPSYIDAFAALLPNVRATHRIARAGHMADYDQPAAVAGVVESAFGAATARTAAAR